MTEQWNLQKPKIGRFTPGQAITWVRYQEEKAQLTSPCSWAMFSAPRCAKAFKRKEMQHSCFLGVLKIVPTHGILVALSCCFTWAPPRDNRETEKHPPSWWWRSDRNAPQISVCPSRRRREKTDPVYCYLQIKLHKVRQTWCTCIGGYRECGRWEERKHSRSRPPHTKPEYFLLFAWEKVQQR